MMKNQITMPSGITIWWRPNEGGGRTYFSDSCGCEAVIWDTCIAGREELQAAMAIELILRLNEPPTPENAVDDVLAVTQP